MEFQRPYAALGHAVLSMADRDRPRLRRQPRQTRLHAPVLTHTALTRWTIGEIEAETTATWSGQFHNVDLDRTPTVATGRFDAVHGDIGRMTGVFGTARQ